MDDAEPSLAATITNDATLLAALTIVSGLANIDATYNSATNFGISIQFSSLGANGIFTVSVKS
jgi:hypothetical protein